MCADFLKGCSWHATTLDKNPFEIPKRSISKKTELSCPIAIQWDDSVTMICRFIVFALARPQFRFYNASLLLGNAHPVTHMDLSLRGRLTPPALRSTSAPENHRYHAMSKCFVQCPRIPLLDIIILIQPFFGS
jgi:hypothetical protein